MTFFAGDQVSVTVDGHAGTGEIEVFVPGDTGVFAVVCLTESAGTKKPGDLIPVPVAELRAVA